MRRFLALPAVVVAMATPAAADLPPYCPMDEGNPALSGYGGYTPFQSLDGFVTLTMHGSDDRDYVIVLQHCATGQQLVAVVRDKERNAGLTDAVSDRFDEMLTSEESFTMHQVRDALNRLGARSTVSRFSGGSCGCAVHGYVQG